MQTLDVRGLSCPIPVLELKKELDKGINELKVVADCGTATENITRFATNSGFLVTKKDIDGVATEFTLSKK